VTLKFNKTTGRFTLKPTKLYTYGFEMKSYRRHKNCSCEMPCQGRFTCEAPDHVGRRATPFCCGQADEHYSWCDTCWQQVHMVEDSCVLKECRA
jgi:hypothetical protein